MQHVMAWLKPGFGRVAYSCNRPPPCLLLSFALYRASLRKQNIKFCEVSSTVRVHITCPTELPKFASSVSSQLLRFCLMVLG
jgi:hypothetical protein